MADVRPLRALRYAPGLDLGSLICPPFDVITSADYEALRRASPYNAVHLELPQDGEQRYAQAAALFREWRKQGVLVPTSAPTFYLLEQRFWHRGAMLRRRALMALVHLEPWEAGVVRPHEDTLRQPKEDRLLLLRALRAQISPVFGLFPDQRGKVQALLEGEGWEELARFRGPDDQRYALFRLASPQKEEALRQALSSLPIYIADGHHRYETALLYREERRAQAPAWTGEEPENFVLMGLVAAEDPGLVLLPIHRLVRSAVPLEMALERLMRAFDVEAVPTLEALLSLMAQRGRAVTVVGLACAQSPDLYLLSALDPEAVARLLPPDSPRQWRHIAAAVAQHAVIAYALGIDEAQVREGEGVHYTKDAHEALRLVREGKFAYALFLEPPRPSQVMAVADAGARMPPKSTYFYPKLPAGLLFYAFDL